LLFRLGEGTIPSPNFLDLKKHVMKGAGVKFGFTRGVESAMYHIPWSKMTGTDGADIILTKINTFNDPVTAL
jgi:hypothetical protein